MKRFHRQIRRKLREEHGVDPAEILEPADEDHPPVLTEGEAREIAGPLSKYAIDVIVTGDGLRGGR